MSSVYVVLVDGAATVAQRDELTVSLQQSPVSFWHHLSNVWIVSDPTGVIDLPDLRDEIARLMPGVGMLAIEVTAINRAVWFADSSGEGWLEKHLTELHNDSRALEAEPARRKP